jgi:hypothetical protein
MDEEKKETIIPGEGEPLEEQKVTPDEAAVPDPPAEPEKEEQEETETPEEEEEGTEETGSGETLPAEGEEPPTAHKYADRLTKAFPDREFKSDEDYEKGMDEYLQELEGYKERGTMANQKLISLFESEPQVGDVVRDMINGATFREALARHISPEDLTAIEGDPDYEGWNKRKAEREELLKKRNAKKEEYDKNLEFTAKAIDEFAKENNMDDEAAAKFLGRFDAMLADINSGKMSKEMLMTMKRAWDYDNDIATARAQGEVAGTNKKIVAQKEKASKVKGDGLPKIGGTSEVPAANNPAPSYIDSLLERTNKKRAL